MGKTITTGKGRIIESVITDFSNMKGFVAINGKLNFVESYNADKGTIIVNEGTELVLNSKVRFTKMDVEIIETNSAYDGKVLPLKSSQWHHAYKQLNRIIQIEIVELDTNTVVAKTPTPDFVKKAKQPVRSKNRE